MVDNVNGLNALPFGATANNVPAHIQLLKDDLNGGSIIRRLTGAQIAALSAPEKVAGVVVYNTTTNKLQISDGTNFANVDAAALLRAGGTMSGAIAMGSNKITGLAKGTANGDAIARQQVQSGIISPGSGSTGNISFDVAFGSTPVVVMTPDATTSGTVNLVSVSNTGFSAYRNGNVGIYWIAVGN